MSKTSELPDLPKRRGLLKFKLTYAQVLSLWVDRCRGQVLVDTVIGDFR